MYTSWGEKKLLDIAGIGCNWLNQAFFPGPRKMRALTQVFYQFIEDITRWREDMNFIFEWQNNMFFLLYRHADDGVFDNFPKISEDFPKLFRIPDEHSRTFSENFRRCPKISEDFRGRPEDVSMIHQRI